VIYFEKNHENFVSQLSAISMPMDFDRSNHTIVKRIITKWSLDEKRRSDTSRYWETKKLVVTFMGGKTAVN
jgi:hypothetical protein